jgi:hypothetical protein
MIELLFLALSFFSAAYVWFELVEQSDLSDEVLSPSIVQLFFSFVIFALTYSFRLIFQDSVYINGPLWLLFVIVTGSCWKIQSEEEQWKSMFAVMLGDLLGLLCPPDLATTLFVVAILWFAGALYARYYLIKPVFLPPIEPKSSKKRQ